MYPEDLKEQQIVRREKAQELKNKGIEPFGQNQTINFSVFLKNILSIILS